ncbi:sporulation protein YunB [Virgibacillus halophilus]|uniref:Sporulation protein YunB n=1 Tax=Tigheibacillus halophilus TaxID=361280 RepID=A0ABU5C386_9BACI|nr:sporulation protein YunB [Virgibacillus halophilus]
MEIATQKTREFATRAINSAVKFAENYTFDDIAHITKDENGNISGVGWDASVYNKINRAATDRVEEFFNSMNRGEPPNYEDPAGEEKIYGDSVNEVADRDPTVVEIPLGQVTGNSVLANLGPKVPVNLELVGSVQTDLEDDIKSYGINNVLISLYVYVEADVQIIVPFTSKTKKVSTKILIDKKYIVGGVPDYYGGNGNGPAITVPKKRLARQEVN